MSFLYLQGDWSCRELGCTFDHDHKTVKRHMAPLNLFLSGNPTPELLTPEEVSDPLRDAHYSIERYFILSKLSENPRCFVRKISEMMSKLLLPLESHWRNALAAEQTHIDLFPFWSQVFFDGLPSSAEPRVVSAAADESCRMISLLPSATLEGIRILGKIFF
jgi:hypothetical protein